MNFGRGGPQMLVDAHEVFDYMFMEYDNLELPKIQISLTNIEVVSLNVINTSNSPTKPIHLSQHPQSMHQTKRFVKGFIHTSNTL